MTIRTLAAAAVAAFLIAGPAFTQAQDRPPAELKAAHDLFDDGLAASIREGSAATRATFTFDGVYPDETEAMLQAFDAGLPAQVVVLQNITAEAAADRWTLDQLTHPDKIPEAEANAMFEVLSPRMHAQGEHFGAQVMKIGCQVRATPSTRCKALLDFVATVEAEWERGS